MNQKMDVPQKLQKSKVYIYPASQFFFEIIRTTEWGPEARKPFKIADIQANRGLKSARVDLGRFWRVFELQGPAQSYE